jgi:DAACS family dicarboxylate/amino acid:cation (Na+ or H+) symporter
MIVSGGKRAMKRILKLKLHWQIFIAMIIGTITGIIFQSLYSGKPEGAVFTVIISLGTIFIRLLRMVIVPLVFTSITAGVASVGSGKALGRLTIKSFSYYIVTSLIAIIIGLVLANLLKPGVGAHIPVSGAFNKDSLKAPNSPLDIVINTIPTNPIEAMTNFDMMGIIFFSIMLGYGITKVKPEIGEPVKQLFNSGFDIMMAITESIIKLAPLGVFGLIAKAVSTAGIDVFKDLALYIFTVSAGLTIHLFIVMPAVIFILTGYNPYLHFKAMWPMIITAFTTSSSNATLPVTMQCVEKNVGVSNKISSFVLPLGATVNMNGTALYECAGVIFISQVLGLHLTVSQQIIIVLTALLAAIGCAGIPAAGVVMIFVVTQAVGFKDADVALIIGTMLAVDRPLDMYRTVLNVFGDSVGAVVVAKSEGEKNFYQDLK